MRRIVTWVLSTVTVVVLLFGYHTSTSGALGTADETVVSSPPPQQSGGSGTSGSAGASGATGSSGAGTGSTAGTRTLTGPQVSTQWGPVQVRLTTKGGTITDVSVIRYPNGNPNDQEVNARALPILVGETLDAQSADIDMVSGATVTSDGYLRSLQGALDQVAS